MKSEKPYTSDAKKDPPRYKSVSQWLWALVAVLGVSLLLTGGWKAQRMLACREWPATVGTVVESELVRGYMREGSLKYRYHLVYSYMVDGREFRNQRISFDGTVPGVSQTRDLPRRYPVGSAVTVRYNSAGPRLAVIETHLSFKGFQPLVIGVVMALLGTGGLCWRWPMQTDYLFRERDPDEPLTITKVLLGGLGMLVCIGIAWIWWELIKMYAGR